MSVVGLDQVGSKAAQVPNNKQGSVMGKEDFLHLLVTQLQHQDPLNPSDSTEFTAQLATFTSLEELQNINSTLGQVGTSQSVLTNSQAVDYIGKQVQAIGDRVYKSGAQTEPMEFKLAGDAAGAYVKVYNAFGEFVQDIELGPLSAGQQSVSWDGTNIHGGQAPDGSYRFEAMAMDAQGNSVEVTTFTTGRVSGVYYKDGTAFLMTADQEIPLGNVVQVYEAQNGQ